MEKNVIDRHNPVRSVIKERYPLTKSGSSKITVHVVLEFGGAPLQFKVGDSIGILPQNDPYLVQRLIEAMNATGSEQIKDSRSGSIMTLRDFLTTKANIFRLNSSLLKLFSSSKDAKTHEPLDILKEYSAVPVPLQALCDCFSPLLPRFYSVASSPHTHNNEVHLTVGLTTFSHQGETRYGVASHFLCNLAKINETSVPIYVQPAHHFTLPEDANAPIIMIGPGTGIAPYRAFMQERVAKGAQGKNWLFFGERNRNTDYFYQEEWETWTAQGKLKVDLAFSRDQEEKIYVQHRLQENGKHIWNWLEEGAYFYVCGDAQFMAKDVEATLQRIAREHGSLDEEAAKAYVKNLRAQKRYLIDVY